ncbi:unnamed protein product [Lathyrus sativus]|nr:unnamed protein product [Lathyrus sativus]
MNRDWDVDLMSYMQIEDLIKSEGYRNLKCLWYWNPNFSFSRGLRPLNNDNDVLRLMEDVRGFKVVDLYVEHKVEEINIQDVIFEKDNGEKVNGEGANVNVEGAKDEEVSVGGVDEEVSVDGVDEEVIVDEVDEDVSVNVDDVDDESETNPNYNMGSEDDEEEDEDLEDEIDMMNLGVDVSINWKTVLPNATAEKASKLDGNFDNGSESDVLQTPPGSDAEGDMEKFPIFKEPTKLEVGMMFKDKQQIKDVIKEYAMENKKNLVFNKNIDKTGSRYKQIICYDKTQTPFTCLGFLYSEVSYETYLNTCARFAISETTGSELRLI